MAAGESRGDAMIADGLEGMFLEVRPALLRYLCLRGATVPEAEDVLQEMFVKLKLHRTGPVGQPRAYLYRMATNEYLLARRGGGRRAQRETRWSAEGGSADGADERPSAEDALAARERLEIVGQALSTLPERTVFILRRFRLDEASQRVIADELGISVSAVEKHLQRAYRALVEIRARLDADFEPPRYLEAGCEKVGADFSLESRDSE